MTNDPYAIHEPETAKLDALRYLQLIYRDPQLSTGVRMRAAIAALNYETPRLAVTAQISENDIATVLDRRIKRLEEMRLREANGSKLIEANKLIEAEAVEAEPIEVRPPTPSQRYRVYSRFNRRF
jgi:hypothetical protein